MNKKVKKLLSIGVLALSLGAILTACSGKNRVQAIINQAMPSTLLH